MTKNSIKFCLFPSGNDVKLYGNSLVSSARLLLEAGADPNATDSVEGDTALLHVRHLLRRGLFAEAAQVAEAMLAVPAADASPSLLPNRVNAANRTLLSYAVACGDAAVDLSRQVTCRRFDKNETQINFRGPQLPIYSGFSSQFDDSQVTIRVFSKIL